MGIQQPYEWNFYGIFRNLRWCCGLVPQFFRNAWRYRGWLAQDADFDWEYLAEVMERKLRYMSAHFRAHNTTERSEQNADECGEAAGILALMRGGESGLELENRFGYDRYAEMTPDEQRQMWEGVRAEEEKNRKRFGELLTKLEWWWD